MEAPERITLIHKASGIFECGPWRVIVAEDEPGIHVRRRNMFGVWDINPNVGELGRKDASTLLVALNGALNWRPTKERGTG